jgi:hypothetical protein
MMGNDVKQALQIALGKSSFAGSCVRRISLSDESAR